MDDLGIITEFWNLLKEKKIIFYKCAKGNFVDGKLQIRIGLILCVVAKTFGFRTLQ